MATGQTNYILRSFCARIRCVDKQIIPLLKEVKPSARAVHRHLNEQVHSNVHQAVIQYVQLTFAQKYEQVHEQCSMNAFRHNTGGVCVHTPRCRMGRSESIGQPARGPYQLVFTTHLHGH